MSRKIFITESDKNKLLKIIDQAHYDKPEKSQYLKELETEINKAEVVSLEHLPGDIITMNSKASLLVGDDEEDITLVYPNDADISNAKISVLSPIGIAILGYREGSIIDWKVPSGTIQIEVKKVLFQPEAQGLYEL